LKTDEHYILYFLGASSNEEPGNYVDGEVGSTTAFIQPESSPTQQTEFSVEKVTSKENAEPRTDTPESIEYNLIDSESFEKALPEKNEDSQSILQVGIYFK
jgi:hypothetical protein